MTGMVAVENIGFERKELITWSYSMESWELNDNKWEDFGESNSATGPLLIQSNLLRCGGPDGPCMGKSLRSEEKQQLIWIAVDEMAFF